MFLFIFLYRTHKHSMKQQVLIHINDIMMEGLCYNTARVFISYLRACTESLSKKHLRYYLSEKYQKPQCPGDVFKYSARKSNSFHCKNNLMYFYLLYHRCSNYYYCFRNMGGFYMLCSAASWS